MDQPTTDPNAWFSPIQARVWTGPMGRAWRIRGGAPLPAKRVEKLIQNPTVPVFLNNGPGGPNEVSASDRSALWTRMRPYLRGQVGHERGDQTEFVCGEFKDGDGHTLLVIDEYC